MSAHDEPTRRMALAMLTETGVKTLESVRDRKFAMAYADMLRTLGDYDKRLGQLKELMSTARARLLVALATREDMDEILVQAEAPERLNN
jgi:hypothetical protein